MAGLVPGAHQGRGLGNKFLDDLRHADALIHVVDVSGTTDAEGKATRGYDPSVDIEWLRSEIVRWVLGNLMEKWYVEPAWDMYGGKTDWLVKGAPSNDDMSLQVSTCPSSTCSSSTIVGI